MTDEPSPKAGTPAGTTAGTGTGPAKLLRLLIVDDSKDGAESLAMLLQIGGHETYTARDGLEAIAAAERHRPDAILHDNGLQKLNGYDVCRRNRNEPWGQARTVRPQQPRPR